MTQWSLVLRARDESQGALNSLFTVYRRPLLAYLERRMRSLGHLQGRGRPLGDAEDVLQGFFAALLRRDFLRNVSAEKGRFRTFVLRSLDYFLEDQSRKVRAEKAGGKVEHESKDRRDESDRPIVEPPASDVPPDRAFDQAFGTIILDKAFRRLREAYRRRGRAAVCEALEPILFGDEDAAPYGELGAKLGMEPQALRTTASRMRGELRELIREEVRNTVAEEEDCEDEFQYVLALFAR